MSARNPQSLGITPRRLAVAERVNQDRFSSTWVRNPSWAALPAVTSSESKFVGLFAVWPDSNFVALSATGAYTVDWGDGVVDTVASGVQANHQYDFTDADLANTNAPVTFTDAGDLVTRTAHGYSDGFPVQFYNITTTTGLTERQIYYVINSTANTFQVATAPGGSAVALTNDGSATLLPYKQAIVTVTMQAGQTFTALNLNLKHTQTNLQTGYASGWLDILISGPSLTTLQIAGNTATLNVTHRYLEQAQLISSNSISSMAYLFNYCSSLRSVPVWVTSGTSLTNTSYMFYNCSSLKQAPLFTTTAVSNMSNMFYSCGALTDVPHYNTVAVSNMSSMFAFCYSLTNVPPFNTPALTNTSSMFSNCASLRTAPFLNTSSVSTGSTMFASCFSLHTVPPYDFSSLSDMTSMFASCVSLQVVPLLTIRTAGSVNMTSLFNGCTNLHTVALLNTSTVTNMSNMFNNCYSLRNIPTFNTASVTNMSGMFSNCTSLQDVPALNVSAVSSSSNFGSMFNGCTNLSRIQASNFRFTFTVASCKLSATALNEIYTNLPTVTAQTITVSGNWGTAGDDPTIATAKGWTVSGS